MREVKGKTQGRPGVRPPVATHAAAASAAAAKVVITLKPSLFIFHEQYVHSGYTFHLTSCDGINIIKKI